MSNHAPKPHSQNQHAGTPWKLRFGILAGSVLFVGAGISALDRGRINWLNWRGQTVFASDMFVFAAVLALIAVIPRRWVANLVERTTFRRRVR